MIKVVSQSSGEKKDYSKKRCLNNWYTIYFLKSQVITSCHIPQVNSKYIKVLSIKFVTVLNKYMSEQSYDRGVRSAFMQKSKVRNIIAQKFKIRTNKTTHKQH